MAYVLGYFAADGCMTSAGNKRVSFESKDLALLENVQMLVGYSNKDPKHYPNKRMPQSKTYVIYWNSKEIYEDLLSLGMTERKSLTLDFPDIPKQYELDFLRGMFDGDGWICETKNGYQAGFVSGSPTLMAGIRDRIETILGKSVNSYSTDENIQQITINDARDLSILFQHLYLTSTPHTRLDRKYEKFMSIKKMDCYFIPPNNSLSWMDRGNNVCFCLAHFYMQYPHYRDYFLKLKEKGKFITLDNGAAEHSIVSQEDLLNIVKELKPNEVISPDILFNKQETISNLYSFVAEMKTRNLIEHTNIFACPQGSTKEEWIECYTEMVNHPNVSVIGLSKIAVPKCWLGKVNDEGIKQSRNTCVDYLIENQLLKKQIHFLGMGDPTEFAHYNHILLRSTDSCYTIYAALNGIKFGEGEFTRIPTVNDYYDQSIPKNIEPIILHNFSFLRKQLK